MPRPTMPPTPVSSTEMKSQDGTHQLSTLQLAFELPPSAIGANGSSGTSGTGTKASKSTTGGQTPSPKSSYPVQPSEAVKSRRRSSTAQKESFALPPPPTRSRKIIQMKPRPQEEPEEPSSPAKPSAGATKTTATSSSKKKQPSSTSAAGRKIARKTAHSLIERRRRSKMNEEFAVLKGLIPACDGEMHKLAILQASIEYVRYLEDCVAQLKSQHNSQSSAPTPTDFVLPPSVGRDTFETPQYQVEDGSGDVEMTGSEAASPTHTEATSRSQRPSESPALLAEDVRRRHDSYSSVSTDHHRHYSYSSAASPAFGPQTYGYARGPPSASNSALTSPALPPQRDLDQEATAALLMLNNDRRGTSGSGAGRGMSVRDLLSA
ncbi:hypothetical protein JX265_010243 [Neoarthrinium moseri]|uniref:BHLH domain-containing protein n=1 Tax=Neoarthrinium moseri TaxID=1658444 RepID=A0A9P9WEJ7_9PEZI|nr:uncharacterized protein JN550_010483 [Neoarthrinium moseri]KAI1844328.1 hypothetical protein JX266_009422 [Neoarthrinium moseri]KAI1859794.1 hypothetical protein JX265_010243 [Neoarthrinium moseri]KAI1862180.1 hypothetical protein JN550_010483 [Neoarthrinium moseri]